MKLQTKPRNVVIGLDGVPHSLLQDLQQLDVIPNMTHIFQDGALSRMSVCIPEISSVSWTSFITGKQSGEHGIYGFMDLMPNTYDLYFPNYSHLKEATIWDDLADHGKTSVVINMPATYPARPISGVLISGFVAIDLMKGVYPESLGPLLQSFGYRIDIDTARARSDSAFLFRDLYDTLEGRRRAVDHLWNEIDWDLFIVVLTGTDRLMHYLWSAYEDPNHAYHGAFLDYYRKIDGFIGEMYDRFASLDPSGQGQNAFYMISDHGFTGIKTEVYLNAWLEENGYLQFENPQPRTIMDIGPGSKAFALDPSRIHINLKGKYPMGCVARKDYERIRSELIQGLEALTYTDGSRVMKKVYAAEALYSGRNIAGSPDLVALSHHGFDLKGKVSSRDVFGRSVLSGMHTQDDAFFYSSTDEACSSIFDAKEILSQGLIGPAGMAASGR